MNQENIEKEIIDSAEKGNLLIVIGTGISISLTHNQYPQLSWKGLISSGLSYGNQKGVISTVQKSTWNTILEQGDIDELLSCAEFVGKKLNSPKGDLYYRWMEEQFKHIKPEECKIKESLRKIVELNIPICTLNYDTLLEDATKLPEIRLSNSNDAISWLKKEQHGVLHLHGVWKDPENCILGVRDYERTLNSEARQLFQRSMAAFNRILFIGCGDTFSDPNFSSLIEWIKKNLKGAFSSSYALVLERDKEEKNKNKLLHGFLEPVVYGTKHDDLPDYLNGIFSRVKRKAVYSPQETDEASEFESAITKYRELLIKDCGQMTIEGVRADLDTAKLRFDIESLFVPLHLKECQTENTGKNGKNNKKLLLEEVFLEETSNSFGQIFAENQRMVLLALPGGGKTLLLKRLAAAYASPDRINRSNDDLPELSTLPILIRCREWRDHIRLPIFKIISKLPELIGSDEISGFPKAITSLLKQGKVLLLIDGLDEIHDDADRTVFVENLQRFITTYPAIRTVITSREAGFTLVAPCLAQFCTRWKIAPLQKEEIKTLCTQWHLLMHGESPQTLAEAEDFSNSIINSSALRKLAENPLLLTMLLVVKHGYGRLPPDRVSLYSRAVEVLLDTWNIKGHDALNPKEAVPQLAYAAFELMKAGKQTATEKELLEILEDARENVPQIKLYAKDTPYNFLKRVELRSSLLVEAGHQLEGGRTVPFYQFRHLTFQEYLAAAAISDGNYSGYRKGATVLAPLAEHTLTDEWKEVIPMVAVLAGKQADPLISFLSEKSEALVKDLIENRVFSERNAWAMFNGTLPAPVARLLQCMIEEAEIDQPLVPIALQSAAYFSRGCSTNFDWPALCRGPYGEKLFNYAWDVFNEGKYPAGIWFRNTCASIAGYRKDYTYWNSEEGISDLFDRLASTKHQIYSKAAAELMGILWNDRSRLKDSTIKNLEKALPLAEKLLQVTCKPTQYLSAWFIALYRYRYFSSKKSSNKALNRLLELWMAQDSSRDERPIFAFALYTNINAKFGSWKLDPNKEQIARIKDIYNEDKKRDNENVTGAYILLCFLSEKIAPIKSILSMIRKAQKKNANRDNAFYLEGLKSIENSIRKRYPDL